MEKQINKPQLRFPEFNGEWERKKLGEIVKINQGLQIDISERLTEKIEGSYFYITNQFLKENSEKIYYIKNPPKSVICEKEDILMTRTGNTGMVFTNVEGVFHNNFFRVAYPNFINKFFLYNFLKLEKTQNQILRMAGTSTIPDLNHSDFYRIFLPYPTPYEQTKIASFLTAIDEKLQALKKKKILLEKYKKGVMQKIFSQELRFKPARPSSGDENGKAFAEWEVKNGNLIFESISDKNHNSDLPILAITQEYGAIPRDLIDYSVSVTDKSIESYKVVQVGDYIISLRSFQGGIEYSEYKGICSPAYIILRPTIPINNIFFKCYFKTENYIKELQKNLEGIRDGKMISYKYFSDIKLPYPSLTEQTHIANFLSAIDDKINHNNTQIQKNEQWKKGLLQKMFV